jgi:hypothetical protein
MVHDDGPVGLDGVRAAFDDERAVADAGIALVATLAARLGIEALAGRLVRLGDRAGAANAGRKVMTLIYAMALGADCIDDCDVVRSGRAGVLLGGRLAAPSTLGTFLRAFTFGHVRQLDCVSAETLARAWRVGAGPAARRLIVDLDSFVGEVHGYPSRARRSATRACGAITRSSPRAPTPARSCTCGSERVGQPAARRAALHRGADRARGARRATGAKLLRADSGFWNVKVFARLEKARWQYSVGVRLRRACARPWSRSARLAAGRRLPRRRRGANAETTHAGRRMIVRRTRTLGDQTQLFPDWQYFPFVTNRAEDIALIEAEHRQHAVVELVIRDLNDQALAHFPSGQFAAWTVIACLAHNLLRWTGVLGLPGRTVRVARTMRRRLLALPGRLGVLAIAGGLRPTGFGQVRARADSWPGGRRGPRPLYPMVTACRAGAPIGQCGHENLAACAPCSARFSRSPCSPVPPGPGRRPPISRRRRRPTARGSPLPSRSSRARRPRSS